MTLKEDVISVLKNVVDPEINLDIWTLGLIYNIDVESSPMHITMTLTTPFCPFGPELVQEVKDKLNARFGEEPEVELTFQPMWEPSPELRDMLGI